MGKRARRKGVEPEAERPAAEPPDVAESAAADAA